MMTGKEKDHDFSFEAVPQNKRKSFVSMFFIMLGFTFFSASMSVGATLGNGLDLGNFIISVLTGSIILSIYTGFLGYMGCSTGLSFDRLSCNVFGTRGSYISSSVITLTQIGWFGVGVAMFSNCASEVLNVSPWVVTILMGACMTTSAYFGIRGMEIISYISVPLITVLGLYSIHNAVTEGGGLISIFSRNTDGLSIIQSIGLVIGSFVAGGTTTPNFTRFAATKKSAVISTVIAFLLGNSLMFFFGAVGGALTGKDDIFYVMMAQGLVVPALLVLGANIWTTNDNTLYNAGLGLANITKVQKRPLVVISGITGTLASFWIYKYFVEWLTVLNAALPPIGTVIIVDYLMNKKTSNTGNVPAVRLGNITSVAAGSIFGLIFKYGIASLNAMAFSAAICLIFNFCTKWGKQIE